MTTYKSGWPVLWRWTRLDECSWLQMPPQTRGGWQRGATPTWEEVSGVRLKQRVRQDPPGLCRGVVSEPPNLLTYSWDLMPPDARNLHPLTNSLHLPIPRRVKTLVVLSDSPADPFPIPTLMTLVSTTVVWIYGGLTIQALDVITGGNNIECRQWARMSPVVYPHPLHL